MAGITCCKDCKDRHLGCHSSCKIYIEQKAELNKCREKDIKYNDDAYYILKTMRQLTGTPRKYLKFD